ncbi:hypothetical protein [Dietzia sp.]|uniref:hypothetical protein n=1 Tax=Dietzia sp. TaxID=1871616 RepID=UPI002FDA6B11
MFASVTGLAATAALAGSGGAAASPDIGEILGSAQVASSGMGSSGTAPLISAGDEDPFYDTSDLSPNTPGEILRTSEAPYSPMFDGPDFALPRTAEKTIYTTEDMHGAPIAASGYVVEPQVPWDGPGERPTVVIGRGTVGQGDQCAPSGNWPLDHQPDPVASKRLVGFEGLYDWVFTTAGVRVVFTDYVCMGTPGMHTYMNRAEQGHAMIDASRAAGSLESARGGALGKVGDYNHFAQALSGAPFRMPFLLDRFRDAPLAGACNA